MRAFNKSTTTLLQAEIAKRHQALKKKINKIKDF